MTKKISPNFLRHSIVLIIFLQSFLLFSQEVVIKITYSWPNYSVENKIELIDPSNSVIATLDDGYTGATNSSDDNISSPFEINKPVNSSSTTGYSVKIYDSYGDGWNGNGYATINVDGVDVLTLNDASFDDVPGSGGVISKEIHFAVNQVLVLDDASFNYSKSGYCQLEANPTPTITGESGGNFSSTSGLIIDSLTGQIDVSTSILGDYVVTYTTIAPYQNSANQNITISDGDVATLEYSKSVATQTASDLSPTTTGVSGSFSSTSGLSINASSGIIDVSTSTIGAYTVSYTTTGSCPKVYTDEVEILAAFPGVSQYLNSSKKYIEYIPGNMPVIISAPHGGVLQAGSVESSLSSAYPHTDSDLELRNCGTKERDDNTDILIREIQKKCYEQYGLYPYIIINNLHRSKLDPNRNKSIAVCQSTGAEKYYDAFHGFIDAASADITAKFGKGLYIDLHGQSHSVPRIEAGYNLSSSSYDEDLDNSGTNVTELSRVTIKNLISDNLQNLSFEELIRGSESLGGLLQTTGGSEYAALGHAGCSRSEGYRTIPSHIGDGSQGTCDDTNPGSNSYFSGDYYNNIRHGSGSTSTANSVNGGGGNVNGGGGSIDGIMTEVNRRVRDMGSTYASYPYPYNRTDTKSATIPYFSRDYATVIKTYIDLHYNDFSKFSYDTSSYSIYGLDATPTIDGISGGTFSSTSGLSINSSTGTIDVSSSTQGTYTVIYEAQNVGSYYKQEKSITINNNAVTNTFTASSGNWSLASNWSLGRLPIANDIISIPLGKTANLDVSNITVADVSVAGTLNVDSGKSVTITGDLETTGTTNIISDDMSSGSIIVDGNSTGNIVYNRYIKDNSNWYIISSPVENQDIDAFASASLLAVGSNNNRGLSTYNNATPAWVYYQNETTTSGNFELGKGYSIRLSSAGNVTFTGNLKTDDVNKSVTVGSNGWNLVGNPYPSFINVNRPADITNNILDLGVNFSILESGFKAIYFWDTVSETYKPINNTSDAKYLAPGQGYFVKVNADGNITLNEDMQSHSAGDYFSKSSSDRFEIKLKINNGLSTEKNTDIKYIAGTTTGLDEGYDAGLFNTTASFSIYTHLVSDKDGTKYALQALPNSNFDTMVVPVGLNANKDSELIFSADFNNIPTGVKVYLEDKLENVFTRIDEGSYKTILEEDENGIGRFYLHTTSETLSVDDLVTGSKVKIYNTDSNTIKVIGINDEEASFKLISVLGKEVLSKKLSNKEVQEVVLPKLNTGIYIIQIKSQSEEISKKIILE